MWSRKSNDNGVTWLLDDMFSDVVSPLPAQPDSGIQATYAGDYDYGSALATKHVTSWVDGRVTISGQSQQDAFTDREPVSQSPTPTPTPTVTPTATPTPTPGQITLSAIGYTLHGRRAADLSWSGATSNRVDIYRNGAVIVTTRNDGFYTDRIGGSGPGSFTYQVCEAGTATCSNQATVTF
jgi:hypothetical protein